jgi:hypothetical protein
MYTAFDFGSEGKVLLNYGTTLTMGTTTPMKLIGVDGTASAYEWLTGGTSDGAQIEISGTGIAIRDIDGGADAVVHIGAPNAFILKEQTLTLESGVTLAIGTDMVGLAGDTNGGATLLGDGVILIDDQTEVKGGRYGWQAFGGTGFIGIGYAAGTPHITATVTGTSLKALGPGATITQLAVASNNLFLGPNTLIELGGTDRAVGGSIILKNSNAANTTDNGKLTFADTAGKITTGNTSGATAVQLASDYITAASGTVISAIGVPYLIGDGNVKATPTVAAVDSKVLAGRIISVEGGTANGYITGGDDTDASASPTVVTDGIISSLTPTVEL